MKVEKYFFPFRSEGSAQSQAFHPKVRELHESGSSSVRLSTESRGEQPELQRSRGIAHSLLTRFHENVF